MWAKLLPKATIPGLHLNHKIRVLIAALVLGLPGLLLAGVVLQPFVDAKWMFFDFLTAAEFSDDCCHVYYGFVSNLGIFLWVATAAICLFAALVFHLKKQSKALIRFALTAGLLSAWLGLDDAFLLHEVVFPKLGVPQFAVLTVYVALALAYVFGSWRVIFSSEFWILGFAGAGVGLSLGIDQILHSIESRDIIMEDSAKFIGIFCWFAFHLVTLVLAFTNIKAITDNPDTGI